MSKVFTRFSTIVSGLVGSAWAFVLAVTIILAWAVTGPVFNFSDTWQLIINTGTTIVTFLMVFLIQNTQNRDAKAMHVKLDELIRSIEGARNQLMDVEDRTEAEIEEARQELVGVSGDDAEAIEQAVERHAPAIAEAEVKEHAPQIAEEKVAEHQEAAHRT
jgi:low affinity Fe/Cu permease